MEASGSSRYLATLQETTVSDKDANHTFRCGWWAIAPMMH
jgi:hypothetical protein